MKDTKIHINTKQHIIYQQLPNNKTYCNITIQLNKTQHNVRKHKLYCNSIKQHNKTRNVVIAYNLRLYHYTSHKTRHKTTL